MEVPALSRYREVAAALRDPRLVPVAAQSTAPAAAIDSAAHAEFRAQALHALSPTAIQPWEQPFEQAAERLVATLPTGEAVDLIARYANPWSLAVAAHAAGVPADQCERLSTLARSIFLSACEPHDEALASSARKATMELGAFFHGAPAWTVQMFVALVHTLPALLGNAWRVLAEHPAAIASLPQAIEELLRAAGPAKAQFRQATAPVTIGECTIQKDQHVILRLDLANNDPEGCASGHLAFGAGAHACVGAALVRSAATIATKALFGRYRIAECHSALSVDGFAMRYVSSLEVTLTAP
jgi:cytochrome P450